jgi:hypothetical protein
VLIDNNSKELKNDYEIFRNWVKKAVQKGDYSRIIKEIKKISEYIYTKIYEPFRQKQKDINKKLIEQLKQQPTMNEIAPWLDIIIFIDRYVFSGIENELFGFVYENYLKELYQDKDKGQYFTDPAVVNFMLNELGYTADKLKENSDKISIIDPSCGAGTFLYSATREIINAFNNNTSTSSEEIEDLVNNNVFGLDIEEFPLFLAEMNILMQLLPIVVNTNYHNTIKEKLKLFITKDSIAEFLNSSINPANNKTMESKQRTFETFGVDNTPSYMRDSKDLRNLFQSLEGELATRLRFDYVIGNPPYIALNKCGEISFAKRMKDKQLSMGNIYGVNLHSIPNKRKKYPPKPNLYAFFIALGLALLKEKGKICYIIPLNVLSTNDLDVLRYYLAKNTTIEKIITFKNQMFIDRGLQQNANISTSSLIFIAYKESPKENHEVSIINFQPLPPKEKADLKAYLKSQNKEISSIMQKDLLDRVENWSFIQQDSSTWEMEKIYKENTDSMALYAEHTRAQKELKNDFWFDVGFILDKNYIETTRSKNNYPILDFKLAHGYSNFKFNAYYPRNTETIGLTKNSQGHGGLGKRYYIVWRIKNMQYFYFTEEPIIFNMGTSGFIASDTKPEMLYLLSLLNSPVNTAILRSNLKNENEKEFLVAIQSIKQYIRVPKITAANGGIKEEIIKQTQILLDSEKHLLRDVVAFPDTHVLYFDKIKVEATRLVLYKNDKAYPCQITGQTALVKDFIDKEGLTAKNEIDFNNLRFSPLIDFDAQKEIKAYIDDLVFALYFNINLPSLGINKSPSIHKTCEENKFYAPIKSKI